MPWIPQGVYSEGQEIDIEFTLTANHWGHIEMYACPDGNASTQDCFVRNPLTMVRDLKYNGPRDPTYPERGYLGSPNRESFRFRYRLPRGVRGNQVMLQWRYVTANSCLPRGYVSAILSWSFEITAYWYVFYSSICLFFSFLFCKLFYVKRNNSELVRRGWARTLLGDCGFPLNWTGQVSNSNGVSSSKCVLHNPYLILESSSSHLWINRVYQNSFSIVLRLL